MTGRLIVGASGLTREALAVVQILGEHTPVQVVDDDQRLWGTCHGQAPVLGGLDLVGDLPDHAVTVGVGKSVARRRIVHRLAAHGVTPDRYASIVHPRLLTSGDTMIGSGCIVLDGVVMTADVKVGDHVVVMPHVTLTHGDRVEDFATLCAGVTLGGDVRVRSGAYLGMSSCVREGTTVGRNATLGMGAVLLQDLPDGESWAGVPARPIHSRIGVMP
jgi:sugar O-acyltransferase (sialic acid O-acetyltransferase NeuD family)